MSAPGRVISPSTADGVLAAVDARLGDDDAGDDDVGDVLRRAPGEPDPAAEGTCSRQPGRDASRASARY
ncbi:hypothetical protein GCM10010517_46470 [Streptosporangium fragile]|uniref:Uncharacterized protein n=1 Tax=Streptosporangium fragile TaxID=46186 RepID=A0ABN3W3U6_9ACTN